MTFRWISAELTFLQLPFFFFSSWILILTKHVLFNFDYSFLFRLFKHINNMATNEDFRNLSNIILHLLCLCAITNSFAYILMLLSCKKPFRKTLNLLRCYCKTESSNRTYSPLELFLCAWVVANILHANMQVILFITERTKNSMQVDTDLKVDPLCTYCTKQ